MRRRLGYPGYPSYIYVFEWFERLKTIKVMEKNSKVRNYIKENWSGKDMEEYLAKKNREWLSKLKEEVKK